MDPVRRMDEAIEGLEDVVKFESLVTTIKCQTSDIRDLTRG